MKTTSPQSVPDGESLSAGMNTSYAALRNATSVAVRVRYASGAGGAACAGAGVASAAPLKAVAAPAPFRKLRRAMLSSDMPSSLVLQFRTTIGASHVHRKSIAGGWCESTPV
jgi:hypothetical protein